MEPEKKTVRRNAGIFAKDDAPSIRPPIREEEDARFRAAKRAAELRSHSNGEDIDGADEFYVDPYSVPDGWTYEWKRRTIFNAEDPAHQVQLARAGWSAVPVSRHPEMMPIGGDYAFIERKGMILMELPTELVEEKRDSELRKARAQVRHKEAQLAGTPDGTLTRDVAFGSPTP